MSRHPFWSDDFDGDLFRLLPAAEGIIAPIAHHKLWTYGGVTNGRLNHPACWHTTRGLTAFFTHVEGIDPRPSRAYYAGEDKALVECTVEEFFRDLMVHQLVVELRGPSPAVAVFDFTTLLSDYHAMLFFHRRWPNSDDKSATAARERTERHLRDFVFRLADRCGWALPIPGALAADCAGLGCELVRLDDCPANSCNRGCEVEAERKRQAERKPLAGRAG